MRLFAGVVNGKNIWKNNYEKTLSILNSLKEKEIQTVVSTSCSLLHVPYSVENETKLEDKYKKHFAFAKEKLTELKEIDEIFSSANYKNNEKYQQNVALFNEDRNAFNAAVDARVKAITPKDFVRQPEFAQREKIQKDEFKLPLFPTTTIGSFPQTAEVRANRKAFRTGEISKEQYIEFNKKKIAECIALQEDLGLDVLVHGEFERNDMVEYFGQHLEGYLFTEKAWVQSYGTRCVKPPVIWGDISRAHPITVDWSVYAQSITDKPLKGMLTGPVTILNWSFPREDIPIKQSVLQLALALRDEVLDLEKRGIKIIQIDEAALREKLPLRKSDWYSEYLDELQFLAETAGVEGEKRFIQNMERPNSKTYVGAGKLEEIKTYITENEIGLVIFDDELSPSQLRNIERELECRILDRTNLILDIFAQRAKTAYAKTQVELAQYQYLLPRLTRMWTHLERQRGGIGMRGPGESQIETDRRIILDKISRLKEQLKKIDKQMASQRGTGVIC